MVYLLEMRSYEFRDGGVGGVAAEVGSRKSDAATERRDYSVYRLAVRFSDSSHVTRHWFQYGTLSGFAVHSANKSVAASVGS
jgi:hypothetical protein